MSYFAWSILALGLALWVIAWLSQLRMVQEINRRREPRDWIPMWRITTTGVLRIYRSVVPQGRLRVVYISCVVGGIILFILAAVIASHSEI